MKITLFKSLNKDTQYYEHHHIENGWINKPIPINKLQQKSWTDETFIHFHGWLDNGKLLFNPAPCFHLYEIY